MSLRKNSFKKIENDKEHHHDYGKEKLKKSPASKSNPSPTRFTDTLKEKNKQHKEEEKQTLKQEKFGLLKYKTR